MTAKINILQDSSNEDEDYVNVSSDEDPIFEDGYNMVDCNNLPAVQSVPKEGDFSVELSVTGSLLHRQSHTKTGKCD